MTLSVTIATYERAEYLRACLASLLGGTELPLEIVIVDQSATPATREVVGSFDSELIRYSRHFPPSISGSRNRSVELARGEYAAVIDDDDEVPADWLETVRLELERHGHPDALYGEIRHPEAVADRKDIEVSIFRPEHAVEWSFPAHPGEMGYGAHMILRRSTFLALGGFDERLGPGTPLLGAEDIDYNYRLLKAGYRAVSTPAIWLTHHQPRLQEQLPGYFYGKNVGHAAFCAKHIHDGDRYARHLFWVQVGGDLRMLASAVRRRSPLRARAAVSRARGTVSGLVRGWRTYRGGAR